MTKQELIEALQSQVSHNSITKQDLFDECKEAGVDVYEDVLFPIGYNTCDRCGAFGDSEIDFMWLDGFDWQDTPKDKALQRALEQEGEDHCAICWECAKELIKKGEQL